MALIISPKILAKLSAKKPPVSKQEVEESFANRSGVYGIDTRAKHLTNPYTRWFIAETNYGRKLKIAFIPEKGDWYLRSAYDPSVEELKLFAHLVSQSTKERK